MNRVEMMSKDMSPVDAVLERVCFERAAAGELDAHVWRDHFTGIWTHTRFSDPGQPPRAAGSQEKFLGPEYSERISQETCRQLASLVGSFAERP